MNSMKDSFSPPAGSAAKLARIGVVLALSACLLLPGCRKEEPRASEPMTAATSTTQPSAPTPAPPPPAVTSLGTLVRAVREEQVDLQVLCVGGDAALQANSGAEVFQAAAGVCSRKDKASKGKTYLVLHFEGQATRELAKEFGKFVATSRSGFLARVDEQSWLGDDQGKKYNNGFAVPKKATRQIAFEVPAQAAGFTWHDGDRGYQISLEPTSGSKQAAVEASKKLPE